jgi:hypothetical protein
MNPVFEEKTIQERSARVLGRAPRVSDDLWKAVRQPLVLPQIVTASFITQFVLVADFVSSRLRYPFLFPVSCPPAPQAVMQDIFAVFFITLATLYTSRS